MSIRFYCSEEEFHEHYDNFKCIKTIPIKLFGREFFMKHFSYQLNPYTGKGLMIDIDLEEAWKLETKTPEQILAAERVAHYRTIMEAAKKDMEYWKGKL